ncbi:unnamed protein product [Amoebophrya sp. A25]|nr:unnamed protein product [Amoebophrya sp. A25]|eukprot:GSA25T00012261001.1
MSRLMPINKIGLNGKYQRLPPTSVKNNIDLKKSMQHGEGTVYLADKGLWYNHKTQFYYDPVKELWHDPKSGLWNQPGEPDWFQLDANGDPPPFEERDPVVETIYIDEEGNFEDEQGKLVYINTYGYFQHFNGNVIEQYKFAPRYHAESPRHPLKDEVPIDYIFCFKDKLTGEVNYTTETGAPVNALGSGKYALAFDGSPILRAVLIKNTLPDCIKNPVAAPTFWDDVENKKKDDEGEDGSNADSVPASGDADSADKKASLPDDAGGSTAKSAAASSPVTGAAQSPQVSPGAKASSPGSPQSSVDRRRAPDKAYSPDAYREQAEHEEALHKKHLETLKVPKVGALSSKQRPIARTKLDTVQDIIKHMKNGDLTKYVEEDEVSEIFRRANIPQKRLPFRRPPAQKPTLIYDHSRKQGSNTTASRPACMNFYHGTCKRGDTCYWRHDENPDRPGKPHQENKIYFELLDCPKKHGVVFVKMFPKAGYVCDICGKAIERYSNIYQCRHDFCNFDCCPACANGARTIRCIGQRDMWDEAQICMEVDAAQQQQDLLAEQERKAAEEAEAERIRIENMVPEVDEFADLRLF